MQKRNNQVGNSGPTLPRPITPAFSALCELPSQAPQRESARLQTAAEVARDVAPPLPTLDGMNPKDDPAGVGACLLRVRALLLAEGWARREGDPEGHTIAGALWSLPPSVARWKAKLLLSRLAGDPDLYRWNADPMRTGAQAVGLLDAGIYWLGLSPPAARYRDPQARRAGGWRVSTFGGGQ